MGNSDILYAYSFNGLLDHLFMCYLHVLDHLFTVLKLPDLLSFDLPRGHILYLGHKVRGQVSMGVIFFTWAEIFCLNHL